jgi:hypothetical protein
MVMTESLREKIESVLRVASAYGSYDEAAVAQDILALLADTSPLSDEELSLVAEVAVARHGISHADRAVGDYAFARGRASAEAELEELREKLVKAEREIEWLRPHVKWLAAVADRHAAADKQVTAENKELRAELTRLKAHQFRAAAEALRTRPMSQALRAAADWLEAQEPKAETGDKT